MTREEAINLIKDDLEKWVCDYPYEPDYDGEVSIDISQEFEIGDFLVEADVHVYGNFWYDRGDYFTPPDSGGSISWETQRIEFYDEEGESVFKETYVKELSGEESF